MKRALMAIFSLMMVLTVSLSFAGCSNTGNYEFWGIKIGDREIAYADLTESEQLLLEGLSHADSYVQLKANDTFVYYICQYRDTNNKNYKTEVFEHGTYALYDQKLILYFEAATEGSESHEAVLRDGKIFISQDDAFTLIYKK